MIENHLYSDMNLNKESSQAFKVFHYWADSISFEESLTIQKELKGLAKQSQFCFFGFESSQPVITMGFRSDQSHVLWTEEKLRKHNISQLEIQRGGEATLHSPGQLVIYPIVFLPLLGLKVKDFITALESISKETLGDLGIKTQKEGKFAGLYTKKGKLCFFGIHVSEGVSQHGLSINMDNDLSLFESIKSCGEIDRVHDKLSFYSDISISQQDLFLRWCDRAYSFFNRLKPLQKMKKFAYTDPD